MSSWLLFTHSLFHKPTANKNNDNDQSFVCKNSFSFVTISLLLSLAAFCNKHTFFPFEIRDRKTTRWQCDTMVCVLLPIHHTKLLHSLLPTFIFKQIACPFFSATWNSYANWTYSVMDNNYFATMILENPLLRMKSFFFSSWNGKVSTSNKHREHVPGKAEWVAKEKYFNNTRNHLNIFLSFASWISMEIYYLKFRYFVLTRTLSIICICINLSIRTGVWVTNRNRRQLLTLWTLFLV